MWSVSPGTEAALLWLKKFDGKNCSSCNVCKPVTRMSDVCIDLSGVTMETPSVGGFTCCASPSCLKLTNVAPSAWQAASAWLKFILYFPSGERRWNTPAVLSEAQTPCYLYLRLLSYVTTWYNALIFTGGLLISWLKWIVPQLKTILASWLALRRDHKTHNDLCIKPWTQHDQKSLINEQVRTISGYTQALSLNELRV